LISRQSLSLAGAAGHSLVSKLNAAVNDGVRPPEISANFAKFSAQVKIVSPQDFRRFHRRGVAEMGGAGQGVGAKVE
jgi:hypothetical protein